MAIPTSTHWGNYKISTKNGRLNAIEHYERDRDRTPLAQNLLAAQDRNVRIAKPAIRKSYLDNPDLHSGERRGEEPFVEVSWDTALGLAATALETTRTQHGNEAIYGGSYGWSSAGRFHHAQSQIHRFLNCIGGYTRSLYSYSAGAGEVIVPHVLGMDFYEVMFQGPTLEDIQAHTRLVVCFGGLALKNTQVMSGGLGGHDAESRLRALNSSDIEFVNISPIKEDLPEFLPSQWLPIAPCTDAALMLAIAYTLVQEDLYDKEFVGSHTVGLEKFLPYLFGESDGQPKDAQWASQLTQISASDIIALARRMARELPMIGISWSLQRSEHGEQTYWLATVLAALLGTHGLPGKGVSFGYGSIHNIGFCGRRLPHFRIPALPQGKPAIESYIPVARIADILLHPGEPFHFNGEEITPPKIEAIYWAGGNPYHHHQDLNRLSQAWSKPRHIIVNEPFWTATARRSDIVFPVTTPLEREDLGITPYDCHMTPMPRVVAPFGEALDDYEVFAELAERLGAREAFTEGRNAREWVEYLFGELRTSAGAVGVPLPDFSDFWAGEQFSIERYVPDREFRLEKFRRDPVNEVLDTPSGKIEIYSETINAMNYADCKGHPAWYAKDEMLGAPRSKQYPLHMISNQPKGRLHSQYDHGPASLATKVDGRECVRLSEADATERGLHAGDVLRVYNDRGSCLAVLKISDQLRAGVVELATGAWYDPSGAQGLEVHGNPNTLTRDKGSSMLGQGTTAHSCLVEVERYEGEVPPITVRTLPPLI
ncbi:MAG: molybdopterin-dependent oxidoreductase [Pseudomonadales bacterium]|nr:molybdopterin-dependent oxidoreductase [Pseudomonadales bacterium]